MSEDNNNKAHNNLFKLMMSDPKVAKEFLGKYLPSSVKSKLNLNELTLCKESYIDEELKLQETDVLYRINFNDRPGYIYSLCEHQSTVDKYMAFRMHKYMIRIMDDHVKVNEGAKLPIIVPILFYHGMVSYNAPADIFELFGENQDLAKLTFLQPHKLVDVTKISDDVLKQTIYSGTMEYLYKYIYASEIYPYIEELKESLKKLNNDNDQNFNNILLPMYNYVTIKGETLNKEKVFNIFKDIAGEERRNEMATIAEQFRQEGRNEMATIAEQFRQEGKHEGIQIGINDGIKLTAKNMLNEGISIDLISKVTGLSAEEIKSIKISSNQ